METTHKRGKKPIDYSTYLEAEKVYLAKKSNEKKAEFYALSEPEKKKVLAQIKAKLKKQSAQLSSESGDQSISEAMDVLFKSIKREGAKLTEKQLEKIYSKVDSIKEQVDTAKIEAVKKASEMKAKAKAKAIAEKKAALEAIKKELEELESEK